jgi:phage shock protein A
MSLWGRLAAVFGARANAALDAFEDPRETLDAAYARAFAAWREARRSVVEVLTGEKRLELEAQSLRAGGERHAQAARDAVRAGDDEAARRALRREAAVSFAGERLCDELAHLREQRVALEALAERMRERVDYFRAEKLALGARYAAAKATARAGADAAGLSEGTAGVAAAVERARETARDAQARAAALLQLEAGETLGLAPSGRAADARLEARLASLKTSPPQLSG